MSCLSPPQAAGVAPLTGLMVGSCGALLDDSAGLCCTQGNLHTLDASFERWEVTYHPACLGAYARFRCAIACDVGLVKWWDASIERAHMCKDFCHDLWIHCYAAGAATATAEHLRSEAAFCAFNTGVNRADASACLGHYGASQQSGGVTAPPPSSGTISASQLQRPRPPPMPPRPPPPPSAFPASEAASPSSSVGPGPMALAGIVGGVGIVLLLVLCAWRHHRGGSGHKSTAAARSAAIRRQQELQAASGWGVRPSGNTRPDTAALEAKVEQLISQLGLPRSTSVVDAIAAAHTKLGTIGHGPLQAQVDTLLAHLARGPPPAEEDQLRPIRGRDGFPAATAETTGRAPVPAVPAVPIARGLPVRSSAEEVERQRLHAELDAQLDRQRAAAINEELDEAMVMEGRPRPKRTQRCPTGRIGSTGLCSFREDESESSTARSAANASCAAGPRADPFLDMITAQSVDGPARRRDVGAAEGVRARPEPEGGRPRRAHRRGTHEVRGENGSRSRDVAPGRRTREASERLQARAREGGARAGEPRDDAAHSGRQESGEARPAGGRSHGARGSRELSPEDRRHHRRIAAEMSQKREQRKHKKKEEAAVHVGGWAAAHGTIYEQLASLPQIGPPIFPEAWSAGDIHPGDVKGLRRAYHRAAARVHPDKVQELPMSAQALAEELFKALGESYQKEMRRIENHSA